MTCPRCGSPLVHFAVGDLCPKCDNDIVCEEP
jgi:uncharacterized Zn finger protein (UPF0148 family)